MASNSIAASIPKISLANRFRYAIQKLDYSLTVTRSRYLCSEIKGFGVVGAMWKSLFQEKITFIQKCPDPNNHETILFRRLATLKNRRRVAVDDIVAYIDPGKVEAEYSERVKSCLIGTVTGIGGHKIASTNDKDEPIVLDESHCWIVADPDKVDRGAKVGDSQTYGPIHTSRVIGRLTYLMRKQEHGIVINSDASMEKDLPVLQVELDMDEMTKVHQPERSMHQAL